MFKTSQSNTLLNRLILSVLTGSLMACGGTGQDAGTSAPPPEQDKIFGGLAIDGYLARATVFLDTNNDGTRNAWEPFAFTDNEGYYSYNPNTETNYCAANATAEQAQYCLRTNTSRTDVIVRIDGGYDVTTGEPFVGQLSRRLSNVGESGVSDTLVSPISSLLTNVESSNDQNTILSSLNLESSDLDVNYLNTDGDGGVDSNVLNAALKVHKVVAVLSDRLTDTYTEIGEDFGTPNDATSSVYPQLANQLLSSGINFDLTIADTTSLATVLDNAETQLRQVYERKEFDLPADIGDASNPGNFSRVIDVASDIVDVVNKVIDPNIETDAIDALGQTRAIESVVIKVLEEGSTNDSSIENAADFFTTESNADLVDALLASLNTDTANVAGLANNDFSGSDFDSAEEISNAATLSSDAQPFRAIGGMQIRVSDLDLGSAPNNLDDAEVEVYFNGTSDDIDGSFSACVKFIDDANIDGTLGDGNTRGELVDGFWSLLGANEGNVESYSLLMTITFLGTTYQAIMKPAGTEVIDQVSYEKIRFDNNGDIRVWHSEFGMTQTGTVPNTNEDCEERLPSRVGI